MSADGVLDTVVHILALVFYITAAAVFAFFYTHGDPDTIESFVAGYTTAAMGVVLALVVWIATGQKEDD